MQFHEIFVKEENKLNYYVFYFFNSVKNKIFMKKKLKLKKDRIEIGKKNAFINNYFLC